MAELAQHSPGVCHRGYRRRPRGGTHHLGQLRPFGGGRSLPSVRSFLPMCCSTTGWPLRAVISFACGVAIGAIQRFRRHRARRQLADRHARQPRRSCQGLAEVITQGNEILGQQLHHASALGRPFWSIPIPVLILIGVLVVFAGVLRYTVFGRSIYAIGANRSAGAPRRDPFATQCHNRLRPVGPRPSGARRSYRARRSPPGRRRTRSRST